MRREPTPLLGKQDRSVQTSTEASPSPVSRGATATEDAGQRVALWLEQTLTVQVLASKGLADAVQAAVDSLMAAPSPRHLLEVRDTLLAVTLEDVARWQTETIDAWCALQRGLARHTALQAAVAAEEALNMFWRPSPSITMRPQPAGSAKASPPGNEASKAWERLWLSRAHGAGAPPQA